MLFPPYLKFTFSTGIHMRTFNILWSFHLSVCKGPLLRNSRLCVVRNNLLRVIDIEEGELHEEGLLLSWLQPRLPCVRVVWAESKVAVHLVVEITMKFLRMRVFEIIIHVWLLEDIILLTHKTINDRWKDRPLDAHSKDYKKGSQCHRHWNRKISILSFILLSIWHALEHGASMHL